MPATIIRHKAGYQKRETQNESQCNHGVHPALNVVYTCAIARAAIFHHCTACNLQIMNIGITCYPTYGGSGVVATELGKELATRGHKVHFISYALPFRLDTFHENIIFHEVELPDYPLFEVDLYSL